MARVNDRSINRSPGGRPRRGFSLVELLMVIVLMGIGASVVFSLFDPSVHSQLHAAADVLAADLAYARNLAVANNSEYRLEFDLDANLYRLSHSGTNASLDNLPSTPLADPSDTATTQVTRFSDLPQVGAPVQLAAVRLINSSGSTNVTELRFTSLGGTKSSQPTQIVLTSLTGGNRLAIPIRVDPVTGLPEIGEIQTAPEADSDGSGGESGGSLTPFDSLPGAEDATP